MSAATDTAAFAAEQAVHHASWVASASPEAIAAVREICTEIARCAKHEPFRVGYRSGLRAAAYAVLACFGVAGDGTRRAVVSHEIRAFFAA